MEGKTKWLTTTKNIKERDLAEVGHNKRVSQMRATLAARRELAGSRTGHQMGYILLKIKRNVF